MKNHKNAVIAALAATTFLTAGPSLAASETTPESPKPTAQQTAADKDYGKLSVDASGGFQDLSLTRIAIYEGNVEAAKKFINLADAAFGKAKTDETVFTKAEADLTPPAGKKPAPAASDKPADQMKTPIAWLPVDGEIAIDENFTANPAKKAAVADANKSLQGGDRKAAIDRLKLANVSVDVTLAVMPLEQTIASVQSAASLINDGKYYEASQVVRQAQDKERFDVTLLSGAPPKPVASAK
jgi:hypothetical protein